MYIQQIYTSCLSEAAYYIESQGQAAIIDPLRDIDTYLALAKERKSVIKYIFETHFHADFVSGHIDLSKATGAPIIFGPGAYTKYAIENAKHLQQYTLGNITLQVLHTPGHTLESSCFLLKDNNKEPHAIFTGDTLFVGDVGRPDLSSGDMSSEELAGIMYDTLTQQILPLPDSVIVYPAHGPGSSCGKNLGPNTFSTIGEEKKTNHALQPQTKEQFIASVTEGLLAAPVYFSINAGINQAGYDNIDDVKKRATQALSLSAFKTHLHNGAILLDTRPAAEFVNGYIPTSIFIGLEGRFAEWAGSLLSFDKNIILITEPGKETETAVRLARVGFDKMQGYLQGGYNTWLHADEKIDLIIEIEPDELMMDIPFDPNITIIDVRKESEYELMHLKEADNLPLSSLTDVTLLAQFEENENIYLHCQGGYRSVIAASIFKKEGLHNLRNVKGGWEKIKQEEGANIETAEISTAN